MIIGLRGVMIHCKKVLFPVFLNLFVHTSVFLFTARHFQGGIYFICEENLGYCSDLLILLKAFHCRQEVYNINEVLKRIFNVRNREIEHTKLVGSLTPLMKCGGHCRLDTKSVCHLAVKLERHVL